MENKNILGDEENDKIKSLYFQYLKDENLVDDNWRIFFEGVEFAHLQNNLTSSNNLIDNEFKVINLINGYRNRGHLFTKTNPVRERRKYLPTLAIENFGLSETDLETVFHSGSLIGIGDAKLKAIIEHLEATYCASVGAEYKYIRTPEVVEWLEQKMESSRNGKTFLLEEKKRILSKINGF